MKTVPIISVEGCIGSGKSTFLNYLNKNIDSIAVLKEPLDSWQNVEGENILSSMYKNPKQHTFLFQMYALLTILQQNTNSLDVKAKIIERHMGYRCFIENSYQLGTLSKVEFSVLCQWINYLCTFPYLNMTSDLIIYLKTSPETCFERMKKRNRNEEQNVAFDYIANLHKIHDQFIMNKTLNPKCELIVIDANQDLKDLTLVYDEVKDKIVKFIENF